MLHYSQITATRELGWSRLDFFRKQAEEGCNWGGVIDGGTWGTEAAVRQQLKTAERLIKTDPEFARDVDFWQEVFAEEKVSTIRWGKNA